MYWNNYTAQELRTHEVKAVISSNRKLAGRGFFYIK